MNIKEKAKLFAINAHQGQIRKSEPDKPMIIHPISVGNLLEDYKFNHKVEIEKDILKPECEEIIKQFFKELRKSKESNKK